jgi:hypothetical protein
MNVFIEKKVASLLVLILGLFLLNPGFAAKPVQDPEPTTSPLATDLQNLVTEGNALNSQLAGINLSADTLCSDLLQANRAVNAYIDSIVAVDASLSAPLTLDTDVLQALEDLSAVLVGLGSESVGLSTDLNALELTTDQITIAEGLAAMLSLSADIGVMADRIGEMADRILVMSDNIGLMADRILITQQIQNDNVALTLASILTTQQNLLVLVSVLDTSVYNNDLLSALTSGNLLSLDMGTTVLTVFNMANELAGLSTDVSALKDQIMVLDDSMTVDGFNNMLYVNSDSLVTLTNLSGMVASLATAVQGYAIAIDGLAAITSTPTLTDAIGSMLSLSGDIGVMSNRIGEMADLILAMSDNIGLQADQIVLTQQLQSTNIVATQASILAAQDLAIVTIAAFSL